MNVSRAGGNPRSFCFYTRRTTQQLILNRHNYKMKVRTKGYAACSTLNRSMAGLYKGTIPRRSKRS